MYECDDCVHTNECESAGAEEFDGKAENCPDFRLRRTITAKKWRAMSATEIIDSMEIAMRVLKSKEIQSTTDIYKMLAIISDIAEKLILTKPM